VKQKVDGFIELKGDAGSVKHSRQGTPVGGSEIFTSSGGMLKKVAVIGTGPDGKLTRKDTDGLIETIRNHPNLGIITNFLVKKETKKRKSA